MYAHFGYHQFRGRSAVEDPGRVRWSALAGTTLSARNNDPKRWENLREFEAIEGDLRVAVLRVHSYLPAAPVI